MRFLSLSCLLPALAVALPSSSSSSRRANESGLKDKRTIEVIDGVNHTVFEHAATGATLAFVTNSGICETTTGVNQYSGYLTVGTVGFDTEGCGERC
jgi:hypothetical protein